MSHPKMATKTEITRVTIKHNSSNQLSNPITQKKKKKIQFLSFAKIKLFKHSDMQS
jgi:hypothetical protein